MARRFNQSDPTANAAIGNITKAAKRRLVSRASVEPSKANTLEVMHDATSQMALVRGQGIEQLVAHALRNQDGRAEWFDKYDAYLVTHAAAERVIAAARVAGYQLDVRHKAGQ